VMQFDDIEVKVREATSSDRSAHRQSTHRSGCRSQSQSARCTCKDKSASGPAHMERRVESSVHFLSI